MIRKSPSDDRIYRYLKLNNNLRCLLVSDQDVEKSSACLTVGVGSLYDPPHVNGLAHFLEHMLFLGTRKYPEENHYSKFIQNNGGMKNAATAEDYTYYYFDIKNEAFGEAVDIFSQFFKEPLFTESSTDREMQAVDSEYRKNLSEDSRRQQQLQKSEIVKKGSLLNRFSTGSIDTLKYPEVRDDLLKFHEQYYSSNLMNLVLVGKDSIEHLESLAIENFSDVKDKSATLRDLSQEVVFDETTSYKHLYKVVPNKNLKSLKIYWTLPASNHLWKSKPSNYISHLLGHEGPNSLLSYLIREGLATAATSSNAPRMMKSFDQISLDLSLTDKGELEYMRILDIVYMFINKVRTEGVQEYLFMENKQKDLIDFTYYQKTKAVSYSTMLSNRMAKVPDDDKEMEDLLWRPFAHEIYDPEEIQKRMALLTPTNSFVLYTSKLVEKEEGLQKEKWYETQFKRERFDDEHLTRWMNIMPAEGMRLGFPPKNNFIPQSLISKKKERAADQIKPANPVKISDEPCIWYKQDDSFDQPYVKSSLKLITNDCKYPLTALSQVFSVVWKSCLNEHLREISYMAHLAGINYSIGLASEFFQFIVYGYNDGISNFIQEISKGIQKFDVTREYFENVREKKIRGFMNSKKVEPYQRSDVILGNFLLRHSRDIDELLVALKEELTYDRFLQIKQEWLKNIQLEWLIMGHLSVEEAVGIAHYSEQSLQFQRLNEEELFESRLTQIPDHYVGSHDQLNEDPANPNSAIYVLFQGGKSNFDDQAINSVIFQLLKEPFFNQLRTKEQLGYIVSSMGYQLKHVLHGRFIIQSAAKGPDFLVHRVNEFLQSSLQMLDQLSEEAIEQAKKALIKGLEQKDLTLGQESSRHWYEIVEGEYEFERNEKKIAALKIVTKEQVISYFKQMFFENPRRINIKMYAHSHWENKDEVESYTKLNEEFYKTQCQVKDIEKIENYKIFKLKNSQFPRY